MIAFRERKAVESQMLMRWNTIECFHDVAWQEFAHDILHSSMNYECTSWDWLTFWNRGGDGALHLCSWLTVMGSWVWVCEYEYKLMMWWMVNSNEQPWTMRERMRMVHELYSPYSFCACCALSNQLVAKIGQLISINPIKFIWNGHITYIKAINFSIFKASCEDEMFGKCFLWFNFFCLVHPPGNADQFIWIFKLLRKGTPSSRAFFRSQFLTRDDWKCCFWFWNLHKGIMHFSDLSTAPNQAL